MSEGHAEIEDGRLILAYLVLEGDGEIVIPLFREQGQRADEHRNRNTAAQYTQEDPLRQRETLARIAPVAKVAVAGAVFAGIGFVVTQQTNAPVLGASGAVAGATV
mgnify:CR=1 FL=1